MALLIYQLAVLSFVLALLLLLAVNLAVLPALDPRARIAAAHAPPVSILVPARDEAPNVERCVRSLLEQTYPRFELLVLDDQSTDGTAEILARLAAGDARLRVLSGQPPPAGWLGKAHACRQLATAARGDYLLFADADTLHRPAALTAAMAMMLAGNGSAGVPPGSSAARCPPMSFFAPRAPWGLLSMFPRQVTVTWSERLVIPLMHFAVYTLLPLPAAFRLRSPALAAANGQFMLFSRAAYDACGGHTAVKSQVLEDVALSRLVKEAGYAAVLVDGRDFVTTRMYRGLRELWAGFSKNSFAFFDNSIPFLLAGMSLYAMLYVLPLLWPIAAAAGLFFSTWRPDPVEIAAWILIPVLQYLAAVVTRILLARRFDFDIVPAFLHPLGVALQIAIALNSARVTRSGAAYWKGRRVAGGG